MMTVEEGINNIKFYFPFNKLTADELKDLFLEGKIKTFKKGNIIIKEGDIGKDFAIILEGKVRISTVIPGIGEESLNILNTGDFFGEMSLLEDAPRSATVIAHEDTIILSIPKQGFNNLVDRNNPAAYWLLWGFAKRLSSRLRETDERLKAIFALIRNF